MKITLKNIRLQSPNKDNNLSIEAIELEVPNAGAPTALDLVIDRLEEFLKVDHKSHHHTSYEPLFERAVNPDLYAIRCIESGEVMNSFAVGQMGELVSFSDTLDHTEAKLFERTHALYLMKDLAPPYELVNHTDLDVWVVERNGNRVLPEPVRYKTAWEYVGSLSKKKPSNGAECSIKSLLH